MYKMERSKEENKLFLHLGNNCMISKDKIIAILDLETAAGSQTAKNLIKTVLNRTKIQNIAEKGKEKTLIITGTVSYISPISSITLLKRNLNAIDIDTYLRPENV